MADVVSKRCVVLKDLPCDVTEEEVKGCLIEAHHAAFKYKYYDISRYPVLKDDVRWIVLFHDDKGAADCLRMGSWKWTRALDDEVYKVLPDHCSECIVPQEWIQADEDRGEDYERVKTPPPEPHNDIPFFSYQTDESMYHDTFSSIRTENLFPSAKEQEADGKVSLPILSGVNESFCMIDHSDVKACNSDSFSSGSLFGYGNSSKHVSTKTGEESRNANENLATHSMGFDLTCFPNKSQHEGLTEKTSKPTEVEFDDVIKAFEAQKLDDSDSDSFEIESTESKPLEMAKDRVEQRSQIDPQILKKLEAIKDKHSTIGSIKSADLFDDPEETSEENRKARVSPPPTKFDQASSTDSNYQLKQHEPGGKISAFGKETPQDVKPFDGSKVEDVASNKGKPTEEDFLHTNRNVLKRLEGLDKSSTISSIRSRDLFGDGEEEILSGKLDDPEETSKENRKARVSPPPPKFDQASPNNSNYQLKHQEPVQNMSAFEKETQEVKPFDGSKVEEVASNKGQPTEEDFLHTNRNILKRLEGVDKSSTISSIRSRDLFGDGEEEILSGKRDVEIDDMIKLEHEESVPVDITTQQPTAPTHSDKISKSADKTNVDFSGEKLYISMTNKDHDHTDDRIKTETSAAPERSTSSKPQSSTSGQAITSKSQATSQSVAVSKQPDVSQHPSGIYGYNIPRDRQYQMYPYGYYSGAYPYPMAGAIPPTPPIPGDASGTVSSHATSDVTMQPDSMPSYPAPAPPSAQLGPHISQMGSVSPETQIGQIPQSNQMSSMSSSTQMGQIPSSTQMFQIPPSTQMGQIRPKDQMGQIPLSGQMGPIPSMPYGSYPYHQGPYPQHMMYYYPPARPGMPGPPYSYMYPPMSGYYPPVSSSTGYQQPVADTPTGSNSKLSQSSTESSKSTTEPPRSPTKMKTSFKDTMEETYLQPKTTRGSLKVKVTQASETKECYEADHVYEEIEVPPTPPTCQPHKSKAKSDCSLRIFHEDKSEPVTIPNSRIIVRGLPETASQEAIELFFENKKRTGGGTVKKIELKLNKGAAVIEFENHLDAKSVLEKAASGTLKFTGTNNPLSVSSYIPPPMDPKKLFIQGIADNSTDDFVRLYLEKASQMEPINIIWGQTPGTALVEFDTAPDVNTIQEFCRKRPCEGKAWEVSEVEQSRSVKVTGYEHRASNETMELYFENKPKSHGGDVENVEKHFEESAFIIMFKNPEDAVRVCQTSLKHVVDDSVLSVSMYLPCLDRDPSTIVVIPEPVVVTFLDEQAVKFLQKSPLYKRKVEKSLEENYGVPKWTSDQEGELVLEVECNVDPKDVAAKRKVEQWSNNCSRCLSWASEEILVNKDILVAVEIWDDMKKHISQIEVPKPEAIAVFLDNKTSSVTVVGEYKMADWLSKRIISTVNELEEKMERENQIVTKVQTLRHFEVSLIRATRLEGVIKKEEVEVELKGETREFIIKGKIRNVENALQKLKKLLKGFAKQEVAGYTKHGMDLLFKKETRDYIKKQLSKERLVGVWDVLNRGEKLIMYSRNRSDLERVVKILRDTLKEFVVTVDSDCRGLLDNGENSVVKQIQRKHAELVNIVVNQREIRIACLNTLVSEITVEIETYLDSYKMVSEYIDTSSARFTYIMQYKKQELRRIESQYDKLGLRVAVVDETRKKGFKVTGKKDACRQAITKLRELIDNITQTELTLNWPGFDKFVRSSDGRGALSTIEVEDKCLLKVNIQGTENPYRQPESPQQPTGVLARYNIGQGSVLFVAGNILKTDVDAIVNPSFKTLVNTHGLGKALLEQGGQKIQQECDELRRRQSQFEAGTVFGTSAGKLSFKAIYHAVVPIWEGGTNDEMRFLRRAVGNCLKMAERQSMSSIAFPPIGKGRFKFPVQKVAEVLVGRIEEYFRKDGGSSSLRKVVICDNQADSHSFFLRQFSNLEGVQLRHRGTSSERGDRGGRQRCGIAIEVVLESLVAQMVDVIVNSTNTNMDLNVGMISRQLVKAAGESLMQECKSTYPSGIQYGQVAQTSAGDMSIKALFHGVLPRWDDGKGQSEAILVRFVNNCLEKAETRGFTSIAFPALGTGACGFPSDIVASTMFEVVERYSEKTPNSRIKRVLFVIWKDDRATVKAFQAVQDDRKSGARSRSSRETRASVYMLKPQQDFFEEGTGFTASLGAVSLSVIQGDLTKQKTGVIVNSTLDSLDLTMGNVSKAILTAAGRSLQTEIMTEANKRKIIEDGVVVTGPGKLFCRNIVHVRARNSTNGWVESLSKILEVVEGLGHNSVSFPALGTGGKGFSPEDMAKTMYATFRHYCEGKHYRGCLKFIHIVIYESAMVEKFITAIQTLSDPTKDKKSFWDFLPWTKSEPETGQNVTIHIYTESSHRAETVKRHLRGLHEEVEMYFSPTIMSKLKDDQINKVKSCRKENSKVFKTKDGFKIVGYGRCVGRSKEAVEQVMAAFEKDIRVGMIKPSVKLPSNWSKMSLDDKTRIDKLTPNDKDYKKVAQKFTAETGYTQIVQIQRVQNPTLYMQYAAKKKDMENNGQANVERMLWHGTRTPDVANNICIKGFDRNYNSGASHGAGVYLAVKAAMSAQGYCAPDAAGNKYIFYAHVLTGDFCLGRANIRVPPPKAPGNNLVTYDSTTDNPAAPNFFVIFHDSQAYPSYLITFK